MKFVLALCLCSVLEVSASSDITDSYGHTLYEPAFSSLSSVTELSGMVEPGVTTIITAEDIRNSSANTLAELLQGVAGLHVAFGSGRNTNPQFIIRGISSTYQAQTLVMVNGKAITSNVRGDQQYIWGTYPIKAIQRIEVLRGPGSAVHGANAVSGIINIITHDYMSVEGAEFGVSFGSFNETSLWYIDKFKIKNWKFSFSAERIESDGYAPVLGYDFQSFLDDIYDEIYSHGGLDFNPADASLAHIPMNMGYEVIDAWLNGSNGKWHFDLGYQERKNIGTGLNSVGVVTPDESLASTRYFFKAERKPYKFIGNTLFSYNLSYTQSVQDVGDGYKFFPEGAFAGSFPDGLIGTPKFTDSIFEVQATIHKSLTENSKLALGVGYNYIDVFNISETKNFTGNRTPNPGGVIDDVTGDSEQIFLPEKSRELSFAFFESVNYLSDEVELILGARFDSYSDVSSVLSPRMAVVWHPYHSLSFKYLYGESFRSPTFHELYMENNPAVRGNPNLAPEELASHELSMEYSLNKNDQFSLSIYRFNLNNYIDYRPIPGDVFEQADNMGGFEGSGIELEFTKRIVKDLYLTGNYSIARIIDSSDCLQMKGQPKTKCVNMGNFPEKEVLVGFDWFLTDRLMSGVDIHYLGDKYQYNMNGSPRTDSRILVDAFVEHTFVDKLKVKLSVINLLNDETKIATDIPIRGRYGEYSSFKSKARVIRMGVSYGF